MWSRRGPRGVRAPAPTATALPSDDVLPPVGEPRDRGDVDYARLSMYLRALAEPNRLELLRKLQLPHAVPDIRLSPARADRERSPDRPLSRQAVESHLRKLEALGLVRGRAAERDGRGVTEYVVDQARLFLVVEELKRLSLLRTVQGSMTAAAEARTMTGQEAPAMPKGPALVLASGPLEGSCFALAGMGPWVVGRDKGADVSIPYDPFVSKANTRVWREGSRFFAQTLPEARNGTRVNWRRLADGESAALEPGDALGVGRTLLFLRGG